MKLLHAAIAFERCPPSLEVVVETYFGTWLKGAWIDSFRIFAASLVFSALWLTLGRMWSWASHHRIVPLGFWAFQTSFYFSESFGFYYPSGLYLTDLMISSVLALVALIGMIALSTWPSSGIEKTEGTAWFVALLSLSTVLLDAFFVLLIYFEHPL